MTSLAKKNQVSPSGSKISDLGDIEGDIEGDKRDHYFLQFWNDDKPDSILKFTDKYGDLDEKHVDMSDDYKWKQDIDKWHPWKQDDHESMWDTDLHKSFGLIKHNKFKKDDFKSSFGDKDYRKTKFPWRKHEDEVDDHKKQSLLTIKFQTEPEVHRNSFLKVSFGDDESILGQDKTTEGIWGHGKEDVSTKDEIKPVTQFGDVRSPIVPKVLPEDVQGTKTDNSSVIKDQEVQQGNVSGGSDIQGVGSVEGQETTPLRQQEISPPGEITQGTTSSDQGTQQGTVPPQ